MASPALQRYKFIALIIRELARVEFVIYEFSSKLVVGAYEETFTLLQIVLEWPLVPANFVFKRPIAFSEAVSCKLPDVLISIGVLVLNFPHRNSVPEGTKNNVAILQFHNPIVRVCFLIRFPLIHRVTYQR